MPDTVADRIRLTLTLIPCRTAPALGVRELERLAGLRRGVVQKILDRDRADPLVSTLLGCAPVLGTTVDFLAAGRGRPPSKARVRRAVAAARERLGAGGRHRSKVAPTVTPRKGRRLHRDAVVQVGGR